MCQVQWPDTYGAGAPLGNVPRPKRLTSESTPIKRLGRWQVAHLGLMASHWLVQIE